MNKIKLNQSVNDIAKIKPLVEQFNQNDTKLTDLEFKLSKYPEQGLTESKFEKINQTLKSQSDNANKSYRFFPQADILAVFWNFNVEIQKIIPNSPSEFEDLLQPSYKDNEEFNIKDVQLTQNDNKMWDANFMLVIQNESNIVNAFMCKVHDRNTDISFFAQFALDLEDMFIYGSDFQVGLTSHNELFKFSWNNLSLYKNRKIRSWYMELGVKAYEQSEYLVFWKKFQPRTFILIKGDQSRKRLVVVSKDCNQEKQIENQQIDSKLTKLNEIKFSTLIEMVIAHSNVRIDKAKIDVQDVIPIDFQEDPNIDLVIILSNLVKVYLKKSSFSDQSVYHVSLMKIEGDNIKYLQGDFKQTTLFICLSVRQQYEDNPTVVIYSERPVNMNTFPTVSFCKDVDQVKNNKYIKYATSEFRVEQSTDHSYRIFSKYNQRITQNGSVGQNDNSAFQSLFENREYWNPNSREWVNNPTVVESYNRQMPLTGLSQFVQVSGKQLSLILINSTPVQVANNFLGQNGHSPQGFNININYNNFLINPSIATEETYLDVAVTLIEQLMQNNIVYYIQTQEQNEVKKDLIISQIRKYLYEEIFSKEVSSQPIINVNNEIAKNIITNIGKFSQRIEDIVNYEWGRMQAGVSLFYIVFSRLFNHVKDLNIKENKLVFSLWRQNIFIFENLAEEILNYGNQFMNINNEDFFNINSSNLDYKDFSDDLKGWTKFFLFQLQHLVKKTINALNLGYLLNEIIKMGIKVNKISNLCTVSDLIFNENEDLKNEIDILYSSTSTKIKERNSWLYGMLSKVFLLKRSIHDANGTTVDLDKQMEDNCYQFCKLHNVQFNRARGMLNTLKISSIDNHGLQEMYQFLKLSVEYDPLQVSLVEFVAHYMLQYNYLGVVTEYSFFRLIKLRAMNIIKEIRIKNKQELNEKFWVDVNSRMRDQILIQYDLIFEVLDELLKKRIILGDNVKTNPIKKPDFTKLRLLKASRVPPSEYAQLNRQSDDVIDRLIWDALSNLLLQVNNNKDDQYNADFNENDTIVNESLYQSVQNILAKYPRLFKSFILLIQSGFPKNLQNFEEWGQHQTMNNLKFSGQIDQLMYVNYEQDRAIDMAQSRITDYSAKDHIITIKERLRFIEQFWDILHQQIGINKSIDSNIFNKVKELVILTNIFNTIDKGLEDLVKNNLIFQNNIQEIQKNLFKQQNIEDISTKLFNKDRPLHSQVLNILLFLLNQDKHMLQPSLQEKLFEDQFDDSYSRKDIELPRVWDGLVNIGVNLDSYFTHLLSKDIGAQNQMNITRKHLQEVQQLFLAQWYFAAFRRNTVDDILIDRFKDSFQSCQCRQIEMLCGFPTEIENIQENAVVFGNFIHGFAKTMMLLIKKLQSLRKRGWKKTGVMMYNQAEVFDDPDSDMLMVQQRLGCLKETMEWVRLKLQVLDISNEDEEFNKNLNSIQDFVQDQIR